MAPKAREDVTPLRVSTFTKPEPTSFLNTLHSGGFTVSLHGVSPHIPVCSSSQASLLVGSKHLGIGGLPHVARVSCENVKNHVYTGQGDLECISTPHATRQGPLACKGHVQTPQWCSAPSPCVLAGPVGMGMGALLAPGSCAGSMCKPRCGPHLLCRVTCEVCKNGEGHVNGAARANKINLDKKNCL